MYKLITVRVTGEQNLAKEKLRTTWNSVIMQGLMALSNKNQENLALRVLEDKVERLAARLDEQVRRNWELTTQVKKLEVVPV